MNSRNLSQNDLIEAMNVLNNLIMHIMFLYGLSLILSGPIFFLPFFLYSLSLSLPLNFGTASTVQITFILDLMILVFLSLHYPFFYLEKMFLQKFLGIFIL